MSHIIDFSITGLAGRDEVYSQTLDRHVNIFFGRNGSGKTSLLKILHSAMSNDFSILRTVPFSKATVSIYSINFDQVFTYTFDKEKTQKSEKKKGKHTSTIDEGDELLSKYNISKRAYTSYLQKQLTLFDEFPKWKVEPEIKDENFHGWKHEYLPTSRLYQSRKSALDLDISRSDIFTEEYLDQQYAEFLQDLWRDYYTDILSAVRAAQEDGLASILKAVMVSQKPTKKEKVVDTKIAYDRVTKFLERQGSAKILGTIDDFEKNYSTNPQLRSVVGDINEIEKRIAEATSPKDNLEKLIESMFSGNKKIKFGDRSIDVFISSEEKIGLSSLSSGEKHILRILVEVLAVGDLSILIDEPEISMHVDWQLELVNIFRRLNPSTQIIMATHSPEIMANIADKNIFRL